MKAKLTIIAICALMLMANGANAQHRNGNQTHARHLQYQSSEGLYESFSQGHQSYPNPDRELYVNRSCCS
jgi:hypothetical protein